MKTLSFLLLFFMAGCYSSNEADPELVKLFGSHCESEGYKLRTPKFVECVEKIGLKK